MSDSTVQLGLRGARTAVPARGGSVPVPDGLSFDIFARAVVGIIGLSGRGATTVPDVIASLLRPDAGTPRSRGRIVPGLRGRVGDLMKKHLYVDGPRAAVQMMQRDPGKAVAAVEKESATLNPVFADTAVERLMSGKADPEVVAITTSAPGLGTRIASGDLAGQPDYAAFVRRDVIAAATARH